MSPYSIRGLGHAAICVSLFGAAGCSDTRSGGTQTGSPGQCGAEPRRVVEELGSRMRLVSLLAPDTIASREIAAAYDSLATSDLLETWKTTPAHAPGREVSNPWPARLEIASIEPDGTGCRVEADVVYATTADTLSPVERRPVTIDLRDEGGWKVSAFAPSGSGSATRAPASTTVSAAGVPDAANTVDSPANIIRRYYDAIAQMNYRAAYAFWSDGGRASRQSREAFARGFAETASVHATIPDSVVIEGAAGSQYATVPVTVDAELRNGKEQHFAGTYVLRRSMVDGATEEQRRWHIYSANLRPR